MTGMPKPPESPADIAQLQEIRAYVRAQKSPVDFVMKSINDPAVLGAVLHARPFLSGLDDAQVKLVRERARATLHPEQTQKIAALQKGLDQLHQGLGSTRHAIVERCELREDGLQPRPSPETSRAA